MRKFLSIFLTVMMLLSLIAPFRVQTANAAITAINLTYSYPSTNNLSYYNPVPGFGTPGTLNGAIKAVYTMGDVIKGTFTTDASGAHTIYLLDENNNVIDSVTVTVPGSGTYSFTMATSNVRFDGHYYLSADTTAGNTGDVEVFIKYNIAFTQETLQNCAGSQTISGVVYRATGYPDVAVDVYVTYPDNTLAGWYHVNPTSGFFTITFPADGPDSDTLPDVGYFRVFVRDGYSTGLDNDAIVYKTLSNVPSISLNLQPYITPFIYKNTNSQPIVLVLTDQSGNYISGATFTLTNASGSYFEISPGFYRFVINVGNVVDVRFNASYSPSWGGTLTKTLIINTRDLGVFNPFIDINAPLAIPPYGNGPWELDSVQSVYDKLPCTIGNSFYLEAGYYDPKDSTNYTVHDFSYEVNGPVVDVGDGWYLVTGKGKISVSMSAIIWEKANKDQPISKYNACCHTFEKTVDICEVNSCTVGGVTLSGTNIVDSTTVEVGKKVDRLSVSVDPTGAPADLTCSCPNYVVLMYMVNSQGSLVPNAFTVDTWAGTTAKGSVIWYNPQGATGPNIPDQPIQTFKPTGLYDASGSLVETGLKFGDCPFNLYGITFNYPTDTSCGYQLVVKVFGLQRTFDACGNMTVKYPMIAELFDPITVLPTVKKLSATATIWEGAQDPDQILAGVSTVVDITDPKFSGTPTWKFYLNGKSVSGIGVSQTDTGWRFSNICLNNAGTFKIYGYYYNTGCTVREEVTIELKVVLPDFTVELGLADGSKIPSDGILTEGFTESVFVTPKDPRGLHDFGTGGWQLDIGVKDNDCGLAPAVACASNLPGVCCGMGGIGITGWDNPCLDDAPMVDLYFVSECGARIYVTSFKLVTPTVKVDPTEVPFTIPATPTHLTFEVKDAHGHGVPGATITISGVTGFGTGSAGYTWTASGAVTDKTGHADWAFVPPFSGKYVVSADVGAEFCRVEGVNFGALGWGVSTSASFTAVYKAPEKDTTAPTLTVTAPEDGSTVNTATVKVTGTATDNVGVTLVVVNDVPVTLLPDGSFATTVTLVEGANTIVVKAFDAAGNVTTKSVKVTYKIPAPTGTKIVLKIGSDIMTVNGRVVQLDAAPEIKEGRTFLPLRAIAEAFGAQVTWVPETQGITVVLGNNQIGLQIGNNTAVVNGNVLSIVPPYIKNGRTMVPIRVIAEGFGAQVEWDPVNYIVTITMP
ncbi:stalk domain-containing protein [Caldisericum exile]|nr:stalk domain-containing protein [Caldisericum exile]